MNKHYDDEVLRVEDLTVYYETDEGTAKAVNNLDLVVRKGKTVGLVGETGSGKTTTALSILRLIPDPPGVIKSGKVILDGMDIYSLTEGEMDMVRGFHASMIFQDPMTALNPVMTVGDQIAETLRIHEGLNKADSVAKAQEMLKAEGIRTGILLCEYAKPYSALAGEVLSLIPSSTKGILYLEEEVRTGGFGVSLSDHLRRDPRGAVLLERILAPEDNFIIPKQPEHVYHTAGVDDAAICSAVKEMRNKV